MIPKALEGTAGAAQGHRCNHYCLQGGPLDRAVPHLPCAVCAPSCLCVVPSPEEQQASGGRTVDGGWEGSV